MVSLKIIQTLATLGAIACFSSPSRAEDSCRDALVYAARNYFNSYTENQRLAWVYSKSCGGSDSSNSIGLGAMIEAVPVEATFASTSKKKWCEENKQLQAYKSIAEEIESKVSEPTLHTWSSCMMAYSHNINVDSEMTRSNTFLLVKVTNHTSHEEKLIGVTFQSDEGDSVSCDPLISRPAEAVMLPVNVEVAVRCTRRFVTIRRGGESYRILPGGSVTLQTSVVSYLYAFPEQIKEDPEIVPQRQALSLIGEHVGTRAYWSGGKESQLIKCDNAIKPPNNNFELVAIETREEPVDLFHRRGRCGVAPFCDSAGEFCREVYYTKACYINKEWHDWYKQNSAKHEIPYSKESVCGV